MHTIHEFCDSCDALLTDAEVECGIRWDRNLCDHCDAEMAAANPTESDVASYGVTIFSAPYIVICWAVHNTAVLYGKARAKRELRAINKQRARFGACWVYEADALRGVA